MNNRIKRYSYKELRELYLEEINEYKKSKKIIEVNK